jgi:aldehyde dehydrogenase (NAD+)
MGVSEEFERTPPRSALEIMRDGISWRRGDEHTLGPIAPIIKVRGDAEALRVANDTPYGLSGAVFTADEGRGLRFALGVEAAMTHINGSSVGRQSRQSLWWREQQRHWPIRR